MVGIEADLEVRLQGGQPQGILMRHGGPFTGYRDVLLRVEKIDGVKAVTPFIYAQVMLRSKNGASGAVLRGIDPATAGHVIKTLNHASLPDPPPPGSTAANARRIPGIVLGRELAKNLGVIQGDRIYLISPRGMLSPIGHVPSMKQFAVTGFFESGMYEYDQTFAYINLKDAQKILRLPDAVSGLDIRVTDIYQAKKIAEKIAARLGFPYWTRDWMQIRYIKSLKTCTRKVSTTTF